MLLDNFETRKAMISDLRQSRGELVGMASLQLPDGQ